jgi:autotransporter-associated beta strand protein
MKTPKHRRNARSISAIAALLTAASAHAYTYEPPNTTTDLWSTGAHWSNAPVSGPGTELDFSTSTTFPADFINTNTNDLGIFQLAILNLAGAIASGTPVININAAPGSSLDFVDGAVNVASNSNANITYNVNTPIHFSGTFGIYQDGTATVKLAGPIDGTGPVMVTGVGSSTSQKIYFTGQNTYTGSTTVSKGRLVITSDDALGKGTGPGNIILTAGGTFYGEGAITASSDVTINSARGIMIGSSTGSGYGTLDALSGATLTYNGIITDNGTGPDTLLTGSGGGTVALGGPNTFSGGTLITATTLAVSATENLGTATGPASIQLESGRGGALEASSTFTLSPDRGIRINYGGNYRSNGRIDVVPNATFTYRGVISGSSTTLAANLVKTGAGTLFLDGPGNTYAGITKILDGTLAISSESQLGTGSLVHVAGGALQPTTSFALARDILIGPTYSDPTLSNTATIDVPSGVTFTPATIREYGASFTGSLVKQGDGILVRSGGSSYSGTTTINAGTYVAANSVNSAGTGNVILNGGSLAGYGRIHATVLAGAGPHTIAPSATLPSTSTGTLTLGGLTTNANSVLAFNLVTPGASSVNDRLVITTPSALTLNGGSVLITGTSTGLASLGFYKAIQYTGTFTGNLANITLPAAGDIAYSLSSTHDAGFIDIHRGYIGDANDDGTVNFADFVALSNNYGKPNTDWSTGDFNNDHITSFADFVALSNHYGNSITGTSSTATPDELAALQSFAAANPVPEPAAIALVAIPAILLTLRRRRIA